MSIPSIDQISGAFNAIYQGLKYTIGFLPPMYRSVSAGFRIIEIHKDPNMSTTRKAASVLLATANMTAESQLLAHKANLSPNEELHRLASIASVTRLGMDCLDRLVEENNTGNNANIWEMVVSEAKPAIKTAKYMLKMQQIAYNREDFNTGLNAMESAEILYTNREMILSTLKTLYRRTLQASQIATNALQIRPTSSQQTNIQTEIVQTDAREATNSQSKKIQTFYQDLLSRPRETLQGSELPEILDLLNQEIHKELKVIKNKLRECEAIINGEDITHFDTIPFILHGEKAFQKRTCRISAKPIRKVVTVRESGNSKPVYYEWKNLQQALENDLRPSRWPASLAFGPESTIINMEETREVVNELKKDKATIFL